MNGPELQYLMNGGAQHEKKDKYDVETDKAINKYLDSLDNSDLDDPNENKLISKEMKRAKKKQEIINELLPPEVDESIKIAFEILLNEGDHYLPKEDYTSIVNLLKEINESFEKMNAFEVSPDLSVQESLKINEKNIESIFNVAVEKSKESKLDDAMALFLLLSTLVPDDLDYLYRAGVAAQECEKLNLAISCHSTVCELAPDFLESRIFLILCYIKSDQYDKAELEFEILNKLKAETELEDAQTKAIVEIETLLKNHKKAA